MEYAETVEVFKVIKSDCASVGQTPSGDQPLTVIGNLEPGDMKEMALALIASSFIPAVFHFHPKTGEVIGTMDTEGEFHPRPGFEIGKNVFIGERPESANGVKEE